MNPHRRFSIPSACPRPGLLALLTAGLMALPLLTSCSAPSGTSIGLREGSPPTLAGDKAFIRYQCYFFTAPNRHELLKDTEGIHLLGIYSAEDGARLVKQLRSKRGFDLTSAPSVTCKSGQEGTIELIREFIYPTEYEAPKAPKDGAPNGGSFPITPATPTAFETTNLGIEASFKGTKNAKGIIDFDFTFQRRSFQGFVNYGSPIMAPATTVFGRTVEVTITENRIEMPVFKVKRIASNVTLRAGQFVAIGGLISDPQPDLDKLTRKSASSLPGLPDSEDKNIFILIQVEAVDGKGH